MNQQDSQQQLAAFSARVQNMADQITGAAQAQANKVQAQSEAGRQAAIQHAYILSHEIAGGLQTIYFEWNGSITVWNPEDGNAIKAVLDNPSPTAAITSDAATRCPIWIDRKKQAIYIAGQQLQNVKMLYDLGYDSVAIFAEASKQRLFWSQGRLVMMGSTNGGGTPRSVCNIGINYPDVANIRFYPVATGDDTYEMYFATSKALMRRAANLNDADAADPMANIPPATIIHTFSGDSRNPVEFGVNMQQKRLYWLDHVNNALMSISVDGGTPKVECPVSLNGRKSVLNIDFNKGTVYFVDNPLTENATLCSYDPVSNDKVVMALLGKGFQPGGISVLTEGEEQEAEVALAYARKHSAQRKALSDIASANQTAQEQTLAAQQRETNARSAAVQTVNTAHAHAKADKSSALQTQQQQTQQAHQSVVAAQASKQSAIAKAKTNAGNIKDAAENKAKSEKDAAQAKLNAARRKKAGLGH